MEIRARSLTCSYPAPGPWGLRSRRRPAIRELSFAAAPGEVVSLAGRNGSGKSTTLRLLAGLLRPDSGEALLGVIPATRPEARRRLGYVGDLDEFPGGLTVRDILGYAAALAGHGFRSGRLVQRAAEEADLGRWLDVPWTSCSRGVRRLISLAQALLREPAALVLDEPLTGLDPMARAHTVMAIRRAAANGAAVVVSLHDGASIRGLADRLIVLAQGRIQAAGPVEELAAGNRTSGSVPDGGDWLSGVVGGQSPGAS